MTTLSESRKRRYIAKGNKNKQFKKLSDVAKEQAVESIMSTEYLDLRCDWAFKYVMSDPDLLSIYFCELPRMEKESMSEMDYVEGWFHILRKSSNFAGKPKGMDKHFDRVVEAAEIQKMPEDNKMDYFKAMISDKERLEYGEDRYNRGREEQMIDNVKDLLKAGFEAERIAEALGLPLEKVESLRQ